MNVGSIDVINASRVRCHGKGKIDRYREEEEEEVCDILGLHLKDL